MFFVSAGRQAEGGAEEEGRRRSGARPSRDRGAGQTVRVVRPAVVHAVLPAVRQRRVQRRQPAAQRLGRRQRLPRRRRQRRLLAAAGRAERLRVRRRVAPQPGVRVVHLGVGVTARWRAGGGRDARRDGGWFERDLE